MRTNRLTVQELKGDDKGKQTTTQSDLVLNTTDNFCPNYKQYFYLVQNCFFKTLKNVEQNN